MSRAFPMLAVRSRLRDEYMKKNKNATRIQAFLAVNQLSDETIHDASVECASQMPEFHPPVGALGDGHIIDAIIAFFQSDAGKALMDALIKLLLSFLA